MTSSEKKSNPASAKSTARKSDSAPAKMPPGAKGDLPVEKAKATNALAASMPSAKHKLVENGHDYAVSPLEGSHAQASSPLVGASTLAERNGSAKVGTAAVPGDNATIAALDRVRADGTGQILTTNQGVRIADNQHSLKAGLRGPALLEDFILREKITHFDHERMATSNAMTPFLN